MEPEALEQIARALALLDHVGVFIFAVTGALVAARHRQDFVTCAFFAGMTGMGGGTIRDLLIGAPVFWMHDGDYMWTCLSAAFAVWFLRTERWPGRPLRWLDNLGLSAYCAFGAIKALSYGIEPLPAMLMGVITATLGGILRDITAGQPSILLQREIYVTAAISGASTTVGLSMLDFNSWIAGLCGALVCFVIRSGALIWDWQLPNHKG